MISITSRWPLVVRILSFIGAVAGMSSLPFTLKPFDSWGTAGYAVLGVSAVLLFLGIGLEIRNESTRKIFSKSDARGIRDYMFRWIQHGGPVVVWTRDHSWVNDDEMRHMLVEKAKRNDLIVCVPTKTTFSDELVKAGADVVVHGFNDPTVRFTIANYNKDTFSVALARPNSQFHIIEEHPCDSATASMAKDLVELAKARRGQP